MEKKILVIIPVVQTKLADDLLFSIEKNITYLPSRVYIINNSQKYYHAGLSKIPVSVTSTTERVGTNDAWRMAFSTLKRDDDIICIFNDDILIGPRFFEKLLLLMKRFSFCVPTIVKSVEQLQSTTGNRHRLLTKRSGCAMCIRQDLFRKIPPIPKSLKVFFGDDWLFSCARVVGLGTPIIRMLDNPVFHYRGVTTHQWGVKFLRKLREEERSIYHKEFESWRIQQQTKQV